MKQTLQNLSNGETSLVDMLCPKCNKGLLLIASRNTHVPSFKQAEVKLGTLVTSGGMSGVHHAKKAGFIKITTIELKEMKLSLLSGKQGIDTRGIWVNK